MTISAAYNQAPTPITIISATATGSGEWFAMNSNTRQNLAFQANLTAGTASVNIEVSLDGVNACATAAGTITLAANSDGITTSAAWGWWRANVTAISGGGTLTVLASN